jgi:hypothetical protein
MIECAMTSNLSLALRHFSKGLVLGMARGHSFGAIYLCGYFRASSRPLSVSVSMLASMLESCTWIYSGIKRSILNSFALPHVRWPRGLWAMSLMSAISCPFRITIYL